MTTTAAWYRDTGTSPWSGQVGYDGGALVGRFAFTTPATGASSLSWSSGTLQPRESTTWAQSARAGNFRWAVTSGAGDHIGRVSGSAGYAVGGNWDGEPYMTSDGARSVQLMPSTTYYLWIFPSEGSYNHWLITGVSVTLSGFYGNPASPSASDGSFGSAVGITLSGGSSGASFTVTTSCAGRSETLMTRGSGTYLTWTPSVAVYGPLLPNAASAAATITVTTYYGSTSVGTRSTSLTLSFRASDVAPTVSSGWYSHAPYNENRGSGINKYIAGISRSRIAFDSTKVSTRCGATISGFSVICQSGTDTSSPYETPILTARSTVTVKVTDSRGFSASESFTITPLSYAVPSLSQVGVFRCDAQGRADEDGAYYSAEATAVYSGLEGANTAQITLFIKTLSGSYGSGTALSSDTASILGPIDPDTIYDVKLEIADTVGNTGTVTRRLVGRTWAMRFRPNGKGVAWGTAPDGADHNAPVHDHGQRHCGGYARCGVFLRYAGRHPLKHHVDDRRRQYRAFRKRERQHDARPDSYQMQRTEELMMIFVTRVVFSDGKQSNSIEAFDQETQAKKRWHSIIAADIDKDGVQYELVQIVREDGICIASEIIDNRIRETEAE